VPLPEGAGPLKALTRGNQLNVTEPPQPSKFNLDERIVVLLGDEVVADHPRPLPARRAIPGIVCRY
jgi:hypothetical protein